MVEQIQEGGKYNITRDIIVGELPAFSEGETVIVERIEPNQERPDYKYVVLSQKLQKRFQLKAEDLTPVSVASTAQPVDRTGPRETEAKDEAATVQHQSDTSGSEPTSFNTAIYVFLAVIFLVIFITLLVSGVLGKSGFWWVLLALFAISIYIVWHARKESSEKGSSTSIYSGAIACLVILALISGAMINWTTNREKKKEEEQKIAEEQKAEEERKKKAEEAAAAEAAKSEDEKLSDLANDKMTNVTSFSTNACGVEGAPPGSKTVNVISVAYTGYYTKEAGPFLEKVFNDFPNVYYVQLKGRSEGRDVIAFEMCRADIGQVTHWYDWEYDPMFTTWVRNYWVDEQWRESHASNLPPAIQSW
jgi:hypothetical protein